MVPLMSLFLASTAALSSDEDVSHVLNHYRNHYSRRLADTYLEGGDGMACWEAKVLKDCSEAQAEWLRAPPTMMQPGAATCPRNGWRRWTFRPAS